MKRIAAVGIASCLGGNHAECDFGSVLLHDSRLLQQICAVRGLQLAWAESVRPGVNGVGPTVAAVCRRAAELTVRLTEQSQPFVFFSGDHSTAMGIWKGVMTALLPDRRCGLIWIDAHMDAHTFTTSPSGNLHGMPLAALLGQGDDQLQRIYRKGPTLRPEHVVLLGIRSYEAAEKQLLQRLGVRYYVMNQVTGSGPLKRRLRQAVNLISTSTDCYGVSIDLDAIDPRDAPAVGTPEPNGIPGKVLCEALAELNGDPRLAGLEIAEFSPLYDRERRTERLIAELVSTLYGEPRPSPSRLNKSLGSDTQGVNSSSRPISSSQARR